jgi:hypothetical protein
MKTRLFLTVALFAAMTVIASAQTAQQSQNQTGKGRAAGNAWVDANKDGVCDNYENGTRMGRRTYSAGDSLTAVNRGSGNYQGKGMHAGQGPAQGRGQGIAAGKGQARGNGQGRFNGKGPAFVDANKDGICDNIQAANQQAPATK